MEVLSLGSYGQTYLTPGILLDETRNWLGVDLEACGMMNVVYLLAKKCNRRLQETILSTRISYRSILLWM